MEAFPGNSNKSKGTPRPQKNIEKVVTGEVIKKPKPLGKRFKDVFFGGDFKGAARYIAADVFLPAFRNLIVDATTKGIESVIYGESRTIRARSNEYRPRVQYNNPIIRSDPRGRSVMLPDQPPIFPSRSSRHDSGVITLESRQDAERVVESLIDIIQQYEVATVADLNELLGLPASHIDNKWGWDKVAGFDVHQSRDGFVIELPPAQPIQ